MRRYPTPGPGSVVTFTRQDGELSSPLGRGVVAGAALLDPFTRAAWIPVRESATAVTVVRVDTLVDVTGPTGDWHTPAV